MAAFGRNCRLEWVAGGDATLRLKQEIVLGIGGEMLLRVLGFEIATYHLNEGHAAGQEQQSVRTCPFCTGRVVQDSEIVT